MSAKCTTGWCTKLLVIVQDWFLLRFKVHLQIFSTSFSNCKLHLQHSLSKCFFLFLFNQHQIICNNRHQIKFKSNLNNFVHLIGPDSRQFHHTTNQNWCTCFHLDSDTAALHMSEFGTHLAVCLHTVSKTSDIYQSLSQYAHQY